MFTVGASGKVDVPVGLTINGGDTRDNSGRVGLGIKMATGLKSGLFITDNFQNGSANMGAAISSVFNAASFAGYNNIVAQTQNPASVSLTSGNQAANSYSIVAHQMQISATSAKNQGGFISFNDNTGKTNTGNAYGFTSFNYMQAVDTPALNTGYVGFVSTGDFTTDAGSIVTNVYDFYAKGYTGQTNGQIVNRYGLYIDFTNVDKPGTTNAYGVYQSSNTLKNYFNGSVGIGTTTPSAQLHTTGTIRFSSLGAGSLQTDADGNITVSSDEKLKNIQGNFTRGLADLIKINPISYKWNTLSGYDVNGTYSGFSAQNIQLAIPEAVATSSNGFLTLSDRPILATVINAVKDLALKIEKIMAWFGGDGSKFNVSGEVCVDDVCVTKDQFKVMLQNVGGTTNNTPIINTPNTPIIDTPVVVEDNVEDKTMTASSTSTVNTNAGTSTDVISTLTEPVVIPTEPTTPVINQLID